MLFDAHHFWLERRSGVEALRLTLLFWESWAGETSTVNIIIFFFFPDLPVECVCMSMCVWIGQKQWVEISVALILVW